MDEELAKQSYTSTSFVTDKDGNMLEDGVVRTRTGDIIPESEQESIQNIPEDIDGEMPPIELANELPARDGNLDFARDSKTLSEVSQPIEEAEDPNEVSGIGAMFRQSSYVDNMFDYYTDGKVPFSFTKNQVTDDGYDRSSPDVTAAIEELNPSENEIEMLGQAKNYSALETISNSIKADRIDQTEISSHSPFLTIPTMMLIGAGTDPVGIATGVGIGRLAASGLVAIKTAKSALAVRETIRVSKLEATAVTVGAAATSGLTSEYALQQANTQISSEGLYLSTIASGLMAGVITGSSLSIMGNNRTEFLDSLDAEAKVFTDASEVANMTPTTYEKVLGGLSLGGTNKLSVSDNISEREFAYQTGDVSIVKKGTVISNDSAIDIKTKESGYGISASMKIGEIDSKRMDSDIDGKALDEMYQIEAEYNKQKDFMYETEKSKSINEAYTTGKKEIDDSYEQVIKDINDKTEELVRAKNDELLEIRRQESQAKYDKEAEATGVRDQKAQDKIQSKYDKDRTTFEQKLKKYNTTRSQVGKKVDTEVKSLVKKNEAEVIKMRKPVADAEKKLTKSTDRLAKHQDLMTTKEKPTKAMIDKHSKLTEEVKQDKITLGRKERAFNKKQKPTKVNVDEVRARLIKEKLDKIGEKPKIPVKTGADITVPKPKDDVKLTASDLSKIKALEKAKSKIVADAEKLKNKRLKEIDKAKKKATKSRLDDEADLELSTRVESEIGSNWLKKRIDDIFDEDVRSAVKIANNYFKKTGDTLKNINYANMDRIDTNFYVTHRYDPSKMMSDVDGANTAMYNSLRDMIDGDVDETRLMEYATKQVRKIIENEKMNKILDPDTGDMKELKTILPGGTVFKGRKLRINAHLMKDFMRDRVTEVIQDYGHKTSGKIAMKQTWNIDSAESKNDFLRGFMDSSPSSIKRIKHSLDSIDGSVDIDPYRNHLMSKGVRFLTNLNYLNMGGFFGLNTLSELGSVIMFDGIRAFNHIIPALKQSISAASTSPTLKNDMTHMRIGIERVVNERVNLFADPSLADNAGIIDKTMTYATNKMSKFSGLTMVTDVLDTVSALTFVAKIKTGKIDAGHMSDIAHAGLSVDDIKALRDIDFATTNSFGAVEDFDLSKIKDKDLRWKMQRATARNVRGTVLKGDSVQLPSWMVKIQGGTALPKLLFQFLRFPAIAHDKITIRAASNPRIVNSAVGTTTAAMMLWALEELKQAERKKPLTDEEIALKVAGRLPMFSGVGIATQYYDNMDRSGLTGALGVGISRLDRGVNLAYKAKDGKDLSASDQQYLQSMIVPYSFYGVKTLGREIGAIE